MSKDPWKDKPSREVIPLGPYPQQDDGNVSEGERYRRERADSYLTPDDRARLEEAAQREEQKRAAFLKKREERENRNKALIHIPRPSFGGADDGDAPAGRGRISHSAGKILRRLRRTHSVWFAKLGKASWPHKVFYFIYVIPMVLVFLVLSLLLFVPWTFVPPLRPNVLWNESKQQWVRAMWSSKARPKRHGSQHENKWSRNRDVKAPYGYGPEKRLGFWRGFCKKRTWEMYELVREVEHGARRQGLQVVGALSGIIIFAMQVWMMAEEYGKPQIKEMLTALFDGDQDNKAIDAAQNVGCGFYLGSGTALWSGGLENLVWYGLYHGTVALLALCLVLEEVFNVRMGLLAPQWSRTGTGWSMMFLATCCVTSSQNWGVKSQIRTRYLLLYLIFFSGTYNVLRGFFASLFGNVTLIPASIADDTYRNHRLPVRPWSEDAFRYWKRRGMFHIPRPNEKYRVEDMSWTQKGAIIIGDQAVANVVRRRTAYSGSKTTSDGHLFKVEWKDPVDAEAEAGQAGRACVDACPLLHNSGCRFWHGGHTRLPDFDPDDWAQSLHVDKHTGEQYYTALADWDPIPALIRRHQKSNGSDRGAMWMRILFKWYDVRRCWAIGCAVAMVLLHGWLIANDVGISSWRAYGSQYDDAVSSWKSNGGPSETDCAYYAGSSLAVMVQFGSSASSGILSTMAWAITWHCFLLSMCLGVFFVAMTNNRTFGMHFPFGMTLIGPRLSSNSIGWTMGFVAFATLQLGLFPTHSDWTTIARGISYASVASWATFVFPNEPMRNIAARNAFWPGASQAAVKYMEKKKFHHEPYRFDIPL